MRADTTNRTLFLATALALCALPGCSLVTGFDGYHSTGDGDGGGMDAGHSDGGGTGDAGEVDAGSDDAGGGLPDAPIADGGQTDALVQCTLDAECDDGTFCNGAERCDLAAIAADARGCAPAEVARCRSGTTCDEDMDRCLTMCELDPDADDDGVAGIDCGGADCDDSNAGVRPGAPEVCNEVDDNCSGAIDEGVAAGYWRDADSDGFGDPTNMRVGCDAVGWVRNSQDCDDTTALRSPSRSETCNGIDDDCDSLVDDGVTNVYYRDQDDDGFGTSVTTMACTMPAGFANNSRDCNDAAAQVNPGATERCNATDDDCDALVDDGICDFACDATTSSCDLPRQVSSGFEFHCVLLQSGAVWCVGDNNAQQLGPAGGTTASSTSYLRVTGLPPGVAEISAGGAFACARTTGGEVWCWGGNNFGQLGSGSSVASSAMPVRVMLPTGATAAAITAGEEHACAIVGTDAHCWGNNSSGQLGNGTGGGFRNTPTRVSLMTSTSVSHISAGSAHTCAITSGGIQCWGSNGAGELGRGAPTTASATPQPVLGGIVLGSPWWISAGRSFSCVATTTHSYCWGFNAQGQLGDGTTMNRDAPTLVSGSVAANYRFVDAGYQHTCAVRTGTGVVHCWGENADGTLGNGTTSGSTTPVPVTGLTTGQHISTLGPSTCAMTTGSQVLCWGFNRDGQLGDGTTITRTVPTPIDGPSL